MAIVAQGTVKGRGITLSHAIALPEVRVYIEPVNNGRTRSRKASRAAEFRRLAFFGMWKDRADLTDSAAWVRQEREQWQRRAARGISR